MNIDKNIIRARYIEISKEVSKIIYIILLILVVLMIGSCLFIGNSLYNAAINPKYMKCHGIEDDSGNEEKLREAKRWLFDEKHAKSFMMESENGKKIHVYEVNQSYQTDYYCIIVHGYTSRSENMVDYAKPFYDYGCNVLLPDLRGHGQSEGKCIGMGWLDRLDIIRLIQYIISQDEHAKIMLMGVSMGAATVMMVSGEELPANVKAVVADCGFTSVWDVFSYHIKKRYHLPVFPFLYAVNLIAWIRARYTFKRASAINQVKKSNIPTLFIHGDQDTFVPFEMLDKLYDSCAAPKEKVIIQGAKHAEAMYVNGEQYWSSILHFLERYVNDKAI